MLGASPAAQSASSVGGLGGRAPSSSDSRASPQSLDGQPAANNHSTPRAALAPTPTSNGSSTAPALLSPSSLNAPPGSSQSLLDASNGVGGALFGDAGGGQRAPSPASMAGLFSFQNPLAGLERQSQQYLSQFASPYQHPFFAAAYAAAAASARQQSAQSSPRPSNGAAGQQQAPAGAPPSTSSIEMAYQLLAKRAAEQAASSRLHPNADLLQESNGLPAGYLKREQQLDELKSERSDSEPEMELQMDSESECEPHARRLELEQLGEQPASRRNASPRAKRPPKSKASKRDGSTLRDCDSDTTDSESETENENEHENEIAHQHERSQSDGSKPKLNSNHNRSNHNQSLTSDNTNHNHKHNHRDNGDQATAKTNRPTCNYQASDH